MIREAPRIETDRLILRALRAEDLEALAAMWTDQNVVRFVGGTPLTREETWRRCIAACGQWPVTGIGYWIAERRRDGSVVGQLGFADFKRAMQPSIEGQPELGYVFASGVHGRGLALEGCSAAIAWADANLDASPYWAIIAPENEASIALARKLGFERAPDASYRGETIGLFRRDRPQSDR